MIRTTSRLLGILAIISLSGCTFIEKDVGNNFIVGATEWVETSHSPTLDDALFALGPPLSITAIPGGYVLLYQHFEILERQIGINSDRPMLRWFKLSLADADGETDTLILQFNNSDELIASRLSTTREDLGEGGSVMFALNFLSIIDTSELHEDLWGANKWGFSLLQPPLIAQNRDSSPDAGQAGIEQRGTPTNVGQRTLEYR